MLKIIITSDNLYLPLFHDMMVVDLVHFMNHNVVHIYHNDKDFISFSVLSSENEISDIFISFCFTEVFPNKKIGNLGLFTDFSPTTKDDHYDGFYGMKS